MIIFFPTYIVINYEGIVKQLESYNRYHRSPVKIFVIIRFINYGKETITFPNGYKRFAYEDFKFMEYMVELNNYGYVLSDTSKKLIRDQAMEQVKKYINDGYDMRSSLFNGDCTTYVKLPTYFLL